MHKKLKYCVYVLLSESDKKLYIGSTADLKRRLTEHFHGKAPATSSRRPFSLIFCEYFLAKADALRREKYFKTNPGKKMLKLILRESLALVRTSVANYLN
jgi:putative endonuclease